MVSAAISTYTKAMPRHPLCIATVSLSGTLPEKLEAAASVGFDGIELMESDLLTFNGSPSDIRQIAEGLGLAISIFQPFRDFEAMPEPQRTRNFDRAERKFDVMQELGTDLVLVCSNTQAAAIDDDARATADLHEMAERAHKRGLRLGYEALSWGRHVSLWGHAWRIVQQSGHPALGLIVDSFHTLSRGDDYAGIAQVPAEKLFFVQLADAPKLAMDVLSWSRHFRNFPGQGQLDVEGFYRAVTDCGYAGTLSLEIFNDEFRATPARLTARDGLRSLIYFDRRAELPKPAVLDGVEFIEFAIDGESREKLCRFLAALGFHRAGTHRSKDVELWRQGRINLVLNAEADSAASEQFQLHGTSVCAMALRVDDAKRALGRARVLLSPEWQERTGSGERKIPAIRTPDGTLCYLVEDTATHRSIYEDDFFLSDTTPEPPSLLGVDHMAEALPTGRMDSFVLFWKAIFGFESQAIFEIPDPYGLIRSRAMVSADGSVRLPLNISESRQTATGRFVTAFAGAGVQHIAFETSDIAAAVASMTSRGARLLPIPANYYDDLAGRFDIDDAQLATLQRDNLLYDRDEHGEFLHAFTETFEDRFFFEIVERRGYQGFGAINAPVRLAVQAQLREAATLASF